MSVEQIVTFAHRSDPFGARYQQLQSGAIPPWAVEVHYEKIDRAANPSLNELDTLAQKFADSYASPHHFTIGVAGVRRIVNEVISSEIERLKRQNLEVAYLLLSNDKEGAIKWAKGLVLSEMSGEMSLSIVEQS